MTVHCYVNGGARTPRGTYVAGGLLCLGRLGMGGFDRHVTQKLANVFDNQSGAMVRTGKLEEY